MECFALKSVSWMMHFQLWLQMVSQITTVLSRMDSYNGFLINESVCAWLNNLPEFDVYITAHALLCRTLVHHMISGSGRRGSHINAKWTSILLLTTSLQPIWFWRSVIVTPQLPWFIIPSHPDLTLTHSRSHVEGKNSPVMVPSCFCSTLQNVGSPIGSHPKSKIESIVHPPTQLGW